jgi:hypothetical protein
LIDCGVAREFIAVCPNTKLGKFAELGLELGLELV